MHYPIICETSEFDAVILGDGDFPYHRIPSAIMNKCHMLCCCDNAGAEAMKRGFTPNAIVGDGDSITSDFIEQHRDIIHLVDEQDDNDQTKATRFCTARGFRHIAYLGSTGKREDHTLGNISLLATYKELLGINPVMITNHGYFIAAQGSNTFETRKKQQVSIFNVSCSEMSGDGLRWPIKAFRRIWQGTLNEATGDRATIEGDGMFIVFFTFESKK